MGYPIIFLVISQMIYSTTWSLQYLIVKRSCLHSATIATL